jgi:hypothetical protein
MTSALNPKGESKGLAAADSKGPESQDLFVS